MHKILICEDNKIQLKAMGMMLEKYAGLYDAEIIAFDNGDDLVEYCISNQFDVIFLDVDLGNRNGMEIAKNSLGLNHYFRHILYFIHMGVPICPIMSCPKCCLL